MAIAIHKKEKQQKVLNGLFSSIKAFRSRVISKQFSFISNQLDEKEKKRKMVRSLMVMNLLNSKSKKHAIVMNKFYRKWAENRKDSKSEKESKESKEIRNLKTTLFRKNSISINFNDFYQFQ